MRNGLEQAVTKWFGVLVVISARIGGVADAEAAPPCQYDQQDDHLILSNGLCRIQWNATANGWSAVFQLNARGEWKTVALDGRPGGAPYEIVEQQPHPDAKEDVFFNAGFGDRFKTTRMWEHGPMQGGYPARTLGAFPPAGSHPQIVQSDSQRISLVWGFPVTAADEPVWRVDARFTIQRGAYHVSETVRFTRRIAGYPVRVRRVWHITGIPRELISSSVRSVTQMAWRLPHGTFMALATHDRSRAWTPLSGGGGMINLTLGSEHQQFIDGKYQTSPDQAFLHQAPPCMDTQGWLDLRKGETYTLRHHHILHPAYPFKRALIDYMHRLQPQEYLPPRYPWRYFIDKCCWTLRYTPESYEDGGDWGLYWKCWYNLTNDPKGGQTHVDRVHSLDWGASWDIWNAYFLLLYAQRHDDDWCRQRYEKLRNAIVMLDWQIDQPGALTDGAFWMERDEQGNFHISNWMAKDNPRTLWVCDAGKIGYFLCLLYERTGDEILLNKARRAAEFLLRVQKEDGDLLGSVFTEEGEVAWKSNLGGVTSAVLLWGKLYQITEDERYLAAARQAADFSHGEWMSNDRWQLHGGEIDSLGVPDSTTSMYAAMGYAALALATGDEKHKDMTRDAANHLYAQQWLFDVNYGYYRKKARWNGMDCKTVGALQGWIRPECTMCMYMAWKATGDPAYRYSMEQHANWMTHMQYDNPDSPKTFGGGHEVFEVPADQLNGFGSNFWPETVGQAIAMILLLEEDRK